MWVGSFRFHGRYLNLTVEVRLVGFLPKEACRDLFLRIKEILEENPWSVLLIDASDFRLIGPNVQEWLCTTWFPQVFHEERCKSGLTVINSKEFFGQLVVTRTLESFQKVQPSFHYTIQDTREDALIWATNSKASA